MEKYVVVPENQEYKNGPGYKGKVLRDLGFPPGPYVLGTAKILIRQAKTVDPRLRLKIVDYVAE